MTTIAYRDGIIAYDSIVTCQGSVVYKDYDKSRLFKDQFVAIGSGWKFALMAMDLGLSAEDAVKKASERCIYTGGEIKVFKVSSIT